MLSTAISDQLFDLRLLPFCAGIARTNRAKHIVCQIIIAIMIMGINTQAQEIYLSDRPHSKSHDQLQISRGHSGGLRSAHLDVDQIDFSSRTIANHCCLTRHAVRARRVVRMFIRSESSLPEECDHQAFPHFLRAGAFRAACTLYLTTVADAWRLRRARLQIPIDFQ
jgi:hypothetical protein